MTVKCFHVYCCAVTDMVYMDFRSLPRQDSLNTGMKGLSPQEQACIVFWKNKGTSEAAS